MKLGQLVEEIDARQRKMDVDFAVHQEYTRGMLEKILEQTKLTNGKVTTNTLDIATLNDWRSRLKGMWIAVVIGAAVFSTIVTLAINLYIKNT